MSPYFNPKCLVLAGCLLATAAHAADATGTGGKSASALASGNDIVTSAVNVLQLQDQFSHANWMGIQVDFTAAVKPPAQYLNDVAVTLKVAWGTTPPVDLVLSSTVKLIGVGGGRKNTVYFFIPPETLARSIKGTPYPPTQLPSYYVVEYKIGDGAVPMTHSDFSDKLTLTTAKDFSTFADSNSNKSLLFSEATVPAYILTAALMRLGSNAFPAFYPPGADAGH